MFKFAPVAFALLLFVLSADALCPTQCTCNDGLLKATCSGGQLSTVPITLNPRLKELYLNENKIRVLATNSLNFYSQLEILSLSSNKLTTLGRKSFLTLRKLQLLFLDSNQIVDLHRSTFEGLSSTLVLNLARNGLTKLPDRVFDGLHSLEELDLSANRIEIVDQDAFIGLDKLKVLSLRDNRLRYMLDGDTLGELRLLSRLDIGMNTFVGQTLQLATLTSNCPLLKDVRIDYAGLDGLRAPAANNINSLRSLDLRGNALSTLGDDTGALLRSLKCFDIRDNPLVCNCTLKWLRPLLANMSAEVTPPAATNSDDDVECIYTTDRIATSILCAEPEHVRNLSISEVDFDDRHVCFESFATELEESLALVWIALLVCSAAATIVLIYVKAALFRPAYPKVLSATPSDGTEQLWPDAAAEKFAPTRLHITPNIGVSDKPTVRLAANPLENFDNPNHIERTRAAIGNPRLFAVSAASGRYVNRYVAGQTTRSLANL